MLFLAKQQWWVPDKIYMRPCTIQTFDTMDGISALWRINGHTLTRCIYVSMCNAKWYLRSPKTSPNNVWIFHLLAGMSFTWKLWVNSPLPHAYSGSDPQIMMVRPLLNRGPLWPTLNPDYVRSIRQQMPGYRFLWNNVFYFGGKEYLEGRWLLWQPQTRQD